LEISRGMERQQQAAYQLDLFDVGAKAAYHGACGESGTGSGAFEVSQLLPAKNKQRALTSNLMERIASPSNLAQALKRVCANKGAPGVDGMSVKELKRWFNGHWESLRDELASGRYCPSSVRGVEIPKPGGGMRQLGIPTAKDRLVQQAILQTLEPLVDPTFSESSFGFRPGRSAHMALKQASQYVKEGRTIVVDMDLEKFFDRVNHDILMSRLARRFGDRDLLRLIRRFLESGMMRDGLDIKRAMGTPQGGPLSPLLANLLLDEFDKELEKRGHKFCRYADDCNIYVHSSKGGARTLSSITRFLEEKLKLRVNRDKSAVGFVEERKFLGYRLLRDGRLGVAPKSLSRAKDRVREITRRNSGHVKVRQMIAELNQFLSGWVTYFRLADCQRHLAALSEWIRRKLRCVILKRLKRAKTMVDWLCSHGVPVKRAWLVALSGKGWWRKSGTPQAHEAMGIDWFAEIGLLDPLEKHKTLQN